MRSSGTRISLSRGRRDCPDCGASWVAELEVDPETGDEYYECENGHEHLGPTEET